MLSEKDLEQAKRELSAQALKVYEAVPMGECWDKTQIINELKRKKLGADFNTVGGCLASLVRGKLIEEKPGGFFKRAPFRPTAASAATGVSLDNISRQPASVLLADEVDRHPVTPTQADMAPLRAGADPCEQLLDIAIRLGEFQTRMASLSKDAASLAKELEGVAEAVSSKLAQGTKELQLLREFQSLMQKLRTP